MTDGPRYPWRLRIRLWAHRWLRIGSYARLFADVAAAAAAQGFKQGWRDAAATTDESGVNDDTIWPRARSTCRHAHFGPLRFHLWRPVWGATWLTVCTRRRKFTIGHNGVCRGDASPRTRGVSRNPDCGGRIGWWFKVGRLKVYCLPIQQGTEARDDR